MLFPVVVEQFLAGVGAPHEPAEIERGLDRIEQWYVGDGWYTDGAGQNFDYYAGWAMHLYPLLWARMSGDADRASRYATGCARSSTSTSTCSPPTARRCTRAGR